jgi:transmembrane sensor
MAYSDEQDIKTTLLEGSVRIVAISSAPLVGVNTNKNKPSVVLKRGQQADLVVGENTNNGGEELNVVRDVNVEEAVAWKHGQFQLGATDFSTLMRQLSRWYDVDVVYEGEVPEKKFGGSINRDVNLSRLLEVMHDYGIETKIDGKKLTIMK